jgi:hypothetical protein
MRFHAGDEPLEDLFDACGVHYTFSHTWLIEDVDEAVVLGHNP